MPFKRSEECLKFFLRCRPASGRSPSTARAGCSGATGREVALPPRVLGVLEVLIDRPGQIVARQDLLDGVWKDAFVTDTSLAEAVSFLRQALGDDPQAPRYIQTVHRRGYRFLPALTETPPRGLTPAAREIGVRPQSADYPPDWGLTPGERFAGASGDRAPSAIVKPSIWLELLPWSVAILTTALAISAVWHIATSSAAPEALPVARFDVRPADGTAFDRRAPALAVSADGRVLAWSACEAASDACALYVRPVDRLDATRLPGTDGGASPFFSPDGRWIGFFADGKLKKIAASGGAPSIVADAPAPGGAAWGPDGRIAFAGLPSGGLSLVSDQGGPVTALTTPQVERGEVRHLSPSWLPGGTAVLFTSASSPMPGAPGDLEVVAPGSTSPRVLRGGVTRAAAAGPGSLLISSGNDLQAATFDERTLTLTSAADSVLTSVTGGDGIAQFAISAGGTLTAIRTARPGRALWTDRADADAGGVGRLTAIAVSPDSRLAAGVIADSNSADIWMADLVTGALTRVTYGGTNVSPAWSADGRTILFATRGSGTFGIASRGVADRASTAAIARVRRAPLPLVRRGGRPRRRDDHAHRRTHGGGHRPRGRRRATDPQRRPVRRSGAGLFSRRPLARARIRRIGPPGDRRQKPRGRTPRRRLRGRRVAPALERRRTRRVLRRRRPA